MLAGMAVITFYNRFVFLMKNVPFEAGPKLKRLLEYSMYAVLTAIWVPIVFHLDPSTGITFTSNAYLIAALVAAILTMVRVPSLFVVILSGGLFFYLHLG